MRTVIAIFLALTAAGCQQQVSLRTWQDSVEEYVWDQGNGNAGVLRDLPTPGQWKGFAIISENDPASSTDVNGILLAHRPIGSKTYFVYLVGLVRQQHVEDIRLVAMSASPEGFAWRSSRKNDEALRSYRDFKNGQWKKLFPGRADGPWSYTGFPGEGDVFKLTVAGGKLMAMHEASGATWMLELPQDLPTTAPAVAESK